MMISEMYHKLCTSTSSGHFQAKFGDENGLFLGLVCFDYSRTDDFVSELIDHLNQWVESSTQRMAALRLIFAVSLDSSGHQMTSLVIGSDGAVRPIATNGLAEWVKNIGDDSYLHAIRSENIRSDSSNQLDV